MLTLAAWVLTATAWLRGAEYDEQYTLLITAGTPRPAWPDSVTTAARIRSVAAGAVGPLTIARELRATDVHPPLYFWTAAAWRAMGADSLFGLRLLSVCFALGALGLVGVIARQSGIPPAVAMLVTLGCYGFAYTGAIARGFALAHLLMLAGVACAFGGRRCQPVRGVARGFAGRRGLEARKSPSDIGRAAVPGVPCPTGSTRGAAARGAASGLLLGAAAFTNYLAGFVAAAAIAGVALQKRALAAGMAAGFALWMPAIAWFYLGQRDSRTGQFPEFAWWPGLTRLGRYAVANVFGGLPLYVGDSIRPAVSIAVGGFALGLAGLVGIRSRSGERLRVLLFCAAAPVLGLLGLALAFQTTAIELRYLSFSAPFTGLLLTGTVAGLPRRWAAGMGGMVMAVQALAIGGLMLRPETMQPARAVARAAAAANTDLVLVPFGNDGVGVVAAFAQEAAPDTRLLIVRENTQPVMVHALVHPYRRVALGMLAQDRASRTTIEQVSESLSHPPWRLAALTGTVAVYERACRAPVEGARDVLRGLHDREILPAARDDPGPDRRIRPPARAAARQPADPCDLAPDRAGVGAPLHGDLPGPAGLRLLLEAAREP